MSLIRLVVSPVLPVRLQKFRHSSSCPRQAGTDRADPDSEGLGNVLVAEPKARREHQDLAVPVAESTKCPPHALHLIVQFGAGGDDIYRFGSLIAASVELRHPPHHGRMPHLGSTVMSNHVGRYAKDPRKSVFVTCVVAVSCLECRLEHISE